MDDRERATVAAHVVTAMQKGDPVHLNTSIQQLSVTPWDQDVVAILKAIRRELERQKFAARSSKNKK